MVAAPTVSFDGTRFSVSVSRQSRTERSVSSGRLGLNYLLPNILKHLITLVGKNLNISSTNIFYVRGYD